MSNKIDFEVKTSSNISHISWVRDTGPTTKGTLTVTFVMGSKYEYYGVPQFMVERLMEAEKDESKSVGKTFFKYIRNGNFKYKKL